MGSSDGNPSGGGIPPVLQVKWQPSGGDGAASEGGNPFGGDPSPTHPTVVVHRRWWWRSGGAMPSGGDGAASGGDPFAGGDTGDGNSPFNDGNNPTSLVVTIPSTVARYQLMPKTAS